jgi:hypothetical protein
MAGVSPGVIRNNEVVLLAVLLERGPIKDDTGHATSELFDLFALNGGTIKTLSGLLGLIKRFDGYIHKTVKGKRTFMVELSGVPAEYEDDVLAKVPELIWEKPVADPQPAPTPAPVVVPVALETPSAIQVADALLERVVAILQEPPVQGADPQKLREAWDQLEAARNSYKRLREDFDRQTQALGVANQERDRLRAENRQLSANLEKMKRDNNGAVRAEVEKQVGRLMGAPKSSKSEG